MKEIIVAQSDVVWLTVKNPKIFSLQWIKQLLKVFAVLNHPLYCVVVSSQVCVSKLSTFILLVDTVSEDEPCVDSSSLCICASSNKRGNAETFSSVHNKPPRFPHAVCTVY